MTAYLSSWMPVIQSVLPRSSPEVSPVPGLGALAPAPINGIDLARGNGQPTLVAFVRHCGCPFSEKEVKLLAEQLVKHPKLHVIIVQHSEQKDTEEWFERIGAKRLFTDPSRYTLVSDPERKIYAAWGIGLLGWTGMVNSNVVDSLKSLKEKDGIDLTPTGKGSWRWQNSGGYAVDGQGKIRWSKIAKDSADMCDYDEAAKTIV